MLTKEECLKALCRIQCGAKRNKKCEDCKCFDTKINIWKCVENTNESLIIRNLIEEHFNPKPLKFDSGLYEHALNSYINQLEKALDKACEIMTDRVNIDSGNGKPTIGFTEKEWKEWLMNNETI